MDSEDDSYPVSNEFKLEDYLERIVFPDGL
jgi:hypothetical protein